MYIVYLSGIDPNVQAPFVVASNHQKQKTLCIHLVMTLTEKAMLVVVSISFKP